MAKRNGTLHAPAPLARAARRFESWRRSRTAVRIPEELWSLAEEMAGLFGVNQASVALRIEYCKLKRRVEGAKGKAPKRPRASSEFIELRPGTLAPTAGCLVEFEEPGGAKVKVHLPGDERPDLVALGRLFLECRA